jgi:hypothetical protein
MNVRHSRALAAAAALWLLASLAGCADSGRDDVVGDASGDVSAEDTGGDALPGDTTSDGTGADAVEDAGDTGGPGDTTDAADAEDSTDAGDTGDTGDTGLSCDAPTVICADACGSDAFVAADCVDGDWVCPPGTVAKDDCPPDTCWGIPLPKATCVDGEWTCVPDPIDQATCPELLCGTCNGWEGPVTEEGCTCACVDGAVSCTTDEPTDCVVDGGSELSGVSIAISDDDCVFTLAEAQAGLSIPYVVTVAEPVAAVSPSAQDDGGCDDPGPSGLIVFERLSGGEQSYCLCDVGLCFVEDHTTDLVPGTWEHSFEWDGVNWFGPSDFGNPKGEPFPPGTYTLKVSAKGTFLLGGDAVVPYEVWSTLQITLVE